MTRGMLRTKPINLTLRFSNSPFSFANAPSSVVHTGVKSAGCENRIAHLSPIHLWKSISPWVVLALKLGAMLPSRRRGCSCAWAANDLRSAGSGGGLIGRVKRATKVLASSRDAEDMFEDMLPKIPRFTM